MTSGFANVIGITSSISKFIHYVRAETLWHKIFHNKQLLYFESRKNKLNVNIGEMHSE